VNQRNQWSPAHELIWPCANLDPAAQLCQDQAEILSPIHIDPIFTGAALGTPQPALGHLRANQLDQDPDFDSQVTTLVSYLQPFRNGNIGDILPAALVAVLGGYPKMLDFCAKYFKRGWAAARGFHCALVRGET